MLIDDSFNTPTDATPSDAYDGFDYDYTDTTLYTVRVSQEPSNVSEQLLVLGYELRNLLLILICLILLFKVYSIIKSTFSLFFGRD